MSISGKIIRGMLFASLLLAGACTSGGGSIPQLRPAYNNSGGPGYYGPFENPEDDPQFLQMWVDQQGGG